MARFGLVGKMTALPGQRDTLLALLLQAADLVADAPGCEQWIVHTEPSDPDGIWVTEVWRDEADHAASLSLTGVPEIIGRARPLIAAMGERFTLEPVGGKGLPPAS
ncbi:MAG: antibiotic biosynthesis monooxygenase [Chloroflexota bacterium]|nr:antibiotic biosynthesis monooxygenase [Chloroflexia bacterium]MDQ3226154.1 antibiotic biosynthesis monooxygenase [Chloroflexota bacterium]